MLRYVVVIFNNGEMPDWWDYSGVEHKTKRDAMHELAIAKTDRSITERHFTPEIIEREVLPNDNR